MIACSANEAHYLLDYYIHRKCNYAWDNIAHSLIAKSRLVVIGSDGKTSNRGNQPLWNNV